MLPLIKTSVVEFPNGDEVTTTLVYERLDKHCTKCLKLDHELKECLVARAEAKALKESLGETQAKAKLLSAHESDSIREISLGSAHNPAKSRGRVNESNEPFHFSASNQRADNEPRPSRVTKDNMTHRPYKEKPKIWQERSSYRQSSQARERSRRDEASRGSQYHRGHNNQRQLPPPPSRSYYREIPREQQVEKDTGSSAARNVQRVGERGTPQEKHLDTVPLEALNEAIGEVRDVMLQYTKCADPTEREARIERVRQAEERGQMKETAANMVRASLVSNNQTVAADNLTPERPSATQRLGPSSSNQLFNSGRSKSDKSTDSRERIPVNLRLGPRPLLLDQDSDDIPTERSNERLPATQRLGPVTDTIATDGLADVVIATQKRKPGRPIGSKTAPSKRRTTQAKAKPSPIRRRVAPSSGGAVKASKTARTKKGEASRSGMRHDQTATDSENAPLVNLIPKSTRRRMDFRIPSSPAP